MDHDQFKDWKTLNDLEQIFASIHEETAKDKNKIVTARRKDKGSGYKELYEEILPLIRFTRLFFTNHLNTYKPNDIQCRYAGQRTQKETAKYDWEVLFKNELYTVEVVSPRYGKRDYDAAIELNQFGYSSVSTGRFDVFAEKVNALIIDKAKKKAIKDYNGSLLVIDYPFAHEICVESTVGLQYIEQLIFELEQIEFLAKGVYLLIQPFNESRTKYGGTIYTIK